MRQEFKDLKISVYEPFSAYLLGDQEEQRFEITLLDVVRFAGHACPSMIGAFLISQKVVKEFYPNTQVCVRGEVLIDMPTAPTSGATGPIANVFGFIFGAWNQTGFGGISNQFVRRDLLRFSVPEVAIGTFRFTHVPSQKVIDVTYSPAAVHFEASSEESFQQQWRRKIKAILSEADKVISVKAVVPGPQVKNL